MAGGGAARAGMARQRAARARCGRGGRRHKRNVCATCVRRGRRRGLGAARTRLRRGAAHPSVRFPLSKLSWQETGRATGGRGAQQPPEPEPVISFIKRKRDLRPRLEPESEPELGTKLGPESKSNAELRWLVPPLDSTAAAAATAAKAAAKAAACSAPVGSSHGSHGSVAEPGLASAKPPAAGAAS